jgi:hypothetical protein
MYSNSVKDLFLQKQLLGGLKNSNTDLEGPSFKYFNEKDFKEILHRVEAMGLGIYGIEIWSECGYFDCILYERRGFRCTSPRWYWNAFYELSTKAAQQKGSLLWSASYCVPDAMLGAYKNRLN